MSTLESIIGLIIAAIIALWITSGIKLPPPPSILETEDERRSRIG